ncbi:hypothetical protein [Actinomadura madurae]|nr:hypothetical protein [Actinomadura madurae]MCP9947192.1 hypothetical protein [Actinomadura madurae]MCP9976432.1 hypothetical protein [Actinomadura madurae]MCQ0012075.1 hypothetical protein [Actinomadura madurae]MCQ0012625.1 hypothetical protein [Actinomadura madurae]
MNFPDPGPPSRLVEACLVAASISSAPDDPDERQAFLDLADQLGDGLDRLPPRPVPEVPDGA